MEGDKEKPMSMGRGGILLKMIREKEKAEAAAAAQPVPVASTAPRTEVSPPIMGRGRANLLDLIKTKKYEAPSPKPVPIPIVGQGRASLISRVKAASSVEQPVVQPPTPGPSGDDAGVLGKLSDLTIADTASTSEVSCPTPLPISHQGTGGKPIALNANYIKLKLDPGKGLFNYEVKYNPDIDSRPFRNKLLNQHLQTIGRTKVFDGVTLFLPQKLQQDTTMFESVHPMDGTTVTLTLIYKKRQSMSDNVTFFNVLLKRVMRALSLVRIGQHSFNPKGIHAVPQHKLEVWPGYVTAINEYEGGLMLCIDAKHRVMRTETVRDIMMNFATRPNFKDLATKEVIGISVFTRYNNKTYRVDDIAWDKNPTYEFEKGDEKISLINYYKQHWNLTIKDVKQPLLVHCSKTKLPQGGTQEQLILLVPELCYIASLTDSIRSDFRVMKDLDVVTKMSPNARRDVFRHFVHEIQQNEIPRDILAEWGLQLETELADFSGRVLEPEKIYFGNNKSFQLQPQRPADWSSATCRNIMLRTPDLNHWFILYCQKDTRCSQEFAGMFKNVSKVMGMCVREPQMICLRDDRIETYVQQLRNNIQPNVNLMVIIFPTNRTDRYSAVKRVCCVEMPVPSQVIMSRTISRGDKLKSITEKIALQINCKLGGALWALNIPMENCMICGIDVYHAGIGQSSKGSVAGFVASVDRNLTTWHSKICLQGRHQELVDMLQICMISAIKAYYKEHVCLRYHEELSRYQIAHFVLLRRKLARYTVLPRKIAHLGICGENILSGLATKNSTLWIILQTAETITFQRVHNKRYPDRIIVFRDGVGDGQVETVAKYEVKQLLATFKNIEPSYQPTLTVVIVQKRINTRLFAKCSSGLENPPPGTIVDSYITKSSLYDFYLVSQNIRQGTVSPTHYIVVYDSKNMKPEHIQRLTYKLCHLYYNWPGTIKVPAPCQYAHKLVSLVGQNIQLEPHQLLSDTLYYL